MLKYLIFLQNRNARCCTALDFATNGLNYKIKYGYHLHPQPSVYT